MNATIQDVRAINQVMLYIHRNLIRSFGTLYKLSGIDTSSFSDKGAKPLLPIPIT